MDGHLDDATLASLRAELVSEHARLREEIGAQGAAPETDDLTFADDPNFADRSHSTEERSRAIALVRTLRTTLREVDRALTRLDEGSYGTCERCGNPIAVERLEALPWATRCIQDAQRSGER
jgi:RNA polymerase-binding protein DksA